MTTNGNSTEKARKGTESTGKARRPGGRRHEDSVFQRGDGRWQAAISNGFKKDGTRDRRTVSGKTKKEVLDKLRKLQTAKSEGRLPEPSFLTLGKFLDEWLDHTARLNVRGTTLDSYRLLVDNEVKPRIGDLKLQKVTRLDLRRLYSLMEKDGKSARWRQMVHAVLRKSLGDAADDGIIPFNPAASKKLRPKAEKREAQFLTPDQCTRFLKFAQGDRLAALYTLAVYTGMRQGELFGLRWEDVDLDAARVTVRTNLIERKGHHTLGAPKSAKSRRTISLPALAVEALHQHRRQMMTEGNAGSEFVFVGPTGAFLRKSNFYRRSFKPIIKAANADAVTEAEKTGSVPETIPDCTFHALRHSHATALLRAGEHPKVVQERLGHSSIGLTMDTYSHLVESMDRAAADKIDRLFAVQTPKAEIA